MTTDYVGTRVFKKSSQNSKLTVYLGKRDFVDHLTHVDEIDGVVLIDTDYLRDRKVYGHILAAFRYGREDLDVLGLNFRKDLYLASKCIFPPTEEKFQLTRLQERLIRKLGKNAYPFFFQLPTNCPASVTLQPAPGDTGKPCGVDYELRIYVGENADSKPQKRNSVKLAIRKVTYAPSCQGQQPSIEISKDFVMSPNKLHLEASLDKELYHHGEEIAVNVHIANNSNRTVKKVKVSIKQFADICLFSTAQYKCTVAEIESEDGCPVSPGFNLSKVYYLKPLLANNKSKRGLALDGQIKHEDSNLASSTILKAPVQRENLGIIVKYKVKVKLCLGPLGEVIAHLPFTLMHPKPDDHPSNFNGTLQRNNHLNSLTPTNNILNDSTNNGIIENNLSNSKLNSKLHSNNSIEAVDQNLIQLDTDPINDIEFEDFDGDFEAFARLRLRGESS